MDFTDSKTGVVFPISYLLLIGVVSSEIWIIKSVKKYKYHWVGTDASFNLADVKYEQEKDHFLSTAIEREGSEITMKDNSCITQGTWYSAIIASFLPRNFVLSFF